MKVLSSGIVDGWFEDRFGSRGSEFIYDVVPSRSIPFEIINPPEGTVSFAFILIDYDTVPELGFAWINWMGANLRRTKVEENESLTATDFLQGYSSYSGHEGGFTDVRYGGMWPTDGRHAYTLQIFAVNRVLDLRDGFTYSELIREVQRGTLAISSVSGLYSAHER